MAELRTVKEDIDWQLDWSLGEWGRLPTVEAEIDQWDWADQVDFIQDWPLEEERLLRLERYAAEGLLNPEQQACYAALLQLVEQNRPIIRRLQAS